MTIPREILIAVGVFFTLAVLFQMVADTRKAIRGELVEAQGSDPAIFLVARFVGALGALYMLLFT